MATNRMEWGAVMSQGAGFSDQVVELDFLYPSEGIHNRWSSGFCITATAANWRQAAFILSKPNGKPGLPSQDTMRCPTFPRTVMKEKWSEDLYVASICNGVS